MIVSTKETTSIRLDVDAKNKANIIFKKLGLTMGDAVNLFLHQVSLREAIPFELKVPNNKTKQVFDDILAGQNIEEFSIDELKR